MIRIQRLERIETLLNPKMKYEYLKERFNLESPKGESEFEVACEFCQRKILGKAKLFGTGNPESISLDKGMFHHKDGNSQNNSHNNIQILCHQCRKHFQYLGKVQRYLQKIGRKVEDLPDCTKVPDVYQGGN